MQNLCGLKKQKILGRNSLLFFQKQLICDLIVYLKIICCICLCLWRWLFTSYTHSPFKLWKFPNFWPETNSTFSSPLCLLLDGRSLSCPRCYPHRVWGMPLMWNTLQTISLHLESGLSLPFSHWTLFLLSPSPLKAGGKINQGIIRWVIFLYTVQGDPIKIPQEVPGDQKFCYHTWTFLGHLSTRLIWIEEKTPPFAYYCIHKEGIW
jgi:hypothetical protein